MPEDFARATSAPMPIVLNGKEYLVHKIKPRTIGEIEAWMKSVTPDPRVEARRAIDGLPEGLAKHIWDSAVAEARETWPPTMDSHEGQKLMASAEGEARLVYAILKRGLPSLTIEQARDIADTISMDEFNQLMALSSMGDPGDPKAEEPKPTEAPASP